MMKKTIIITFILIFIYGILYGKERLPQKLSDSIAITPEVVGFIYKRPDGMYSYTEPIQIEAGHVDLIAPDLCPEGTQLTAYYHIHGSTGSYKMSMSPEDIAYAKSRKIDIYLSAPEGETLPASKVPTSVHVPADLDEAITMLEKLLSAEQLADFKSSNEAQINAYHFGIGLWIRQNWSLWAKSQLRDYFNKLGMFHPDDMSDIILTSFHRHLNNKNTILDNQIQTHKNYWDKVNAPIAQ